MGLFSKVLGIARAAWNGAKRIAKSVGRAIGATVEAIGEGIANVGRRVKAAFEKKQSISDALRESKSAVFDELQRVKVRFKDIFAGLFQDLRQDIDVTIDEILAELEEIDVTMKVEEEILEGVAEPEREVVKN